MSSPFVEASRSQSPLRCAWCVCGVEPSVERDLELFSLVSKFDFNFTDTWRQSGWLHTSREVGRYMQTRRAGFPPPYPQAAPMVQGYPQAAPMAQAYPSAPASPPASPDSPSEPVVEKKDE